MTTLTIMLTQSSLPQSSLPQRWWWWWWHSVCEKIIKEKLLQGLKVFKYFWNFLIFNFEPFGIFYIKNVTEIISSPWDVTTFLSLHFNKTNFFSFFSLAQSLSSSSSCCALNVFQSYRSEYVFRWKIMKATDNRERSRKKKKNLKSCNILFFVRCCHYFSLHF